MNNLYILDSCALIALIKRENGWEPVFEVLREAITGRATVFMHEINLLEVYYGLYYNDPQKSDKKKIENKLDSE